MNLTGPILSVERHPRSTRCCASVNRARSGLSSIVSRNLSG